MLFLGHFIACNTSAGRYWCDYLCAHDFHDYGKVLSCRSQQNAVQWDFHSVVRARHCFPSLPSFAPLAWLSKSDCCEEDRKEEKCIIWGISAHMSHNQISQKITVVRKINMFMLNNNPFPAEQAPLTGAFWSILLKPRLAILKCENFLPQVEASYRYTTAGNYHAPKTWS